MITEDEHKSLYTKDMVGNGFGKFKHLCVRLEENPLTEPASLPRYKINVNCTR
jgi:hypothetical protein